MDRVAAAEKRHSAEAAGVPIGKNVEVMALADLRLATVRTRNQEWVSRTLLLKALESLGAAYVALAEAHSDLKIEAGAFTESGDNRAASRMLSIGTRAWNALPWDWPGKSVLEDRSCYPETTRKEPSMDLSNLPPGCQEGDLPGNRPEDVAWEKYLDEVMDELATLGLDVSELSVGDERFVMDAVDDAAENMQDEDGYFPWNDPRTGKRRAHRIAEVVIDRWGERGGS
jgi:hypothetical protein